jgi:hypothetical protein
LYLRFIETGWTTGLRRHLFRPRHALHSARLRIEPECDWQSPLPPELEYWINSTSEQPEE